jgi:tetratricopeptide (TPR) repeat protein/transcriptional regulator with XRE-family HTH domain
VADKHLVSFGKLLRKLRLDAGLTQEELARVAGLSTRAVSDLEREVNQFARRDTSRLLADALNLTGATRAGFLMTSRGVHDDTEGPAAPPVAPTRSIAATTPRLPHDIRTFVGREGELAQLLDAVADDGAVGGIYAIDGMAGIGKSAFAVHAAHLLEQKFPHGQIFLPLHAHTSGQRPVDPTDALASLLLTTGVAAHQIPAGVSERAGLWRAHLAGKKILLLLDDAAGTEQVRPLLPGTPDSLVLITSRRHLTALADATSICLDTFAPGEAAALLIRLADRRDLDPRDPAVQRINDLCGCLPLAIGMLARRLHHHRRWTLAGLADYLTAARGRLEWMQAENLSVAAAFDLSYRDLTEDQQRMFRRLGLHPGTDIDPHAAAALDDIEVATARHRLDELFDQHLVTEPVSGRYRMHALIREHARALAETDKITETEAAVRRMTDYYAGAAEAVGRYFNRGARQPHREPAQNAQPATLADAALWMETERANMHAIVDLAALRKWPVPGIAIATSMSEFLRTHGHWTQMRVMHLTALETARQAGYENGEAWALTNLGLVQRLTGDYAAAARTLASALDLCVRLNDGRGQANVLVVLGVLQRLTVGYPTATATLSKALELYRSHDDELGQADALNEMGIVERLSGDYAAATSSHESALRLYQGLGDRLGQADSLRYLGRVHQETGDYAAVDSSYATALRLYRSLNDRLGQAHTLNYLGIAQHPSGDYMAAEATQKEALQLYRGLGHRLGQAEVLNNLGELLAVSDPDKARDFHEQALRIARDITALLEEARALEGIGTCDIHDAHADHGRVQLRRALEIYQQIGSPFAERVDRTLRFHRL